MTINVVNPFKSQTAKTFDKSKIDRGVHASEHIPSADVTLYSGKKIFKFGTAATVVDDELSKPKPLEHISGVPSSSPFNARADIHVERQKKILSKIKSAKNNIAKLFKPTSRVSAVVPCIDLPTIPGIEHGTTNDHLSSLAPSVLQRAENKACVVTTYGPAPPRHTNSEAISLPIAHDEDVADERIEDVASTICTPVEDTSPSTGQLFATPESQLDTFLSTFLLSELHTIEEEDGNKEVVVGVANREQEELGISVSYISRSDSDSEVTVYLSSYTLSDHTAAHGTGLVSSGTSTSPANTSFATSVDADSSLQFSAGALRGLRRVPNCEDLRNLHIIENRDSSCSDVSCGSSDCDSSYGANSGINSAPLRRLEKCDNLRESFFLLEPKIFTPSTRQMNKYRKFRAWLITRYNESSTHKPSVSRAPNSPQKATPVSRGCQFLQSIFHPSFHVQAHVFKPSPHRPSIPSSPPVWSCAKITRSGSKAKKRRRMTKRSMEELRARLDSMDIDPWR